MKKTISVGLLALATAWGPQAIAATADSITACMRANVPKSLTVRQVQLDASDAEGHTRTLHGRFYATREDDRLRAMIRISSPSDLAGASYLLRERDSGDEMYMYMPALQKVRRITGGAVDGSLWGTDLSYADIKQIGNVFDGRQPTLEPDTTLDGRAVHVLSVTPGDGESAKFSRVQAWVDAQHCVALRVDFYEGQTVRKRLSVDPKDVRQDGAYWYASQLRVQDLSQKTQTILKVLDVQADDSLAGRLFNPGTFYVGN
ncbi:outer membrane lipoprotein-sorting protein [Solimonas marina]|uniref:Outer membrane lipoprotein-sorting protein n=1 Tax=Solimonas marina TaxID=2714601 RepID=A0A969WBX7_9GAMM|nr:outer membrane lipoprotein-sorting protein [Solimonas marina]NKF23714.1 outer membrane lipoprotein-sorting protein [Solimonas marina]